MNKTIIAVGILGAVLGLAVLLIAGAPVQGSSSPAPALQGGITGSGDTINFQGQLYDNDGTPVAPGSYGMHFVICRDGSNAVNCQASAEWSRYFTGAEAVTVDGEGLFSVLLSGIEPQVFVDDDGIARDRYLMVEVWDAGSSNWDWMQPNQQITSMALAIGYIRKYHVESSNQSILTVINSADGRGITGQSNVGIGVYGASNTSIGVYASGGQHGVYAENSPTGVYGSGSGYGVYGYSPPAAGETYGVYGGNGSTTGGGGYFWADNSDGSAFGVRGRSDGSSGYGVVAHHYWYGTGLGVWSYGGDIIRGYKRDYPNEQDLRVKVDNGGNVYAYSYNYLVGQEQGFLYTMGSPGMWAEDFGTATLANGLVTVTIEPLFADAVSLTVDYHVFVTVLGDEPVLLFVSAKEPEEFTVRGVTLDGKPADVSFDYRIVAKRLGYENLRMESIPVESPPPKEP